MLETMKKLSIGLLAKQKNDDDDKQESAASTKVSAIPI
jgi:hypothetical protein